MGMDVIGKNATSKTGEYFRNNAWHWRPLWNYCHAVAPDLIGEELYRAGHYNDGAGLDGPSSRTLALRLRAEIASGRCAIHAADYTARLEGIPDEDCSICGGTGRRLDPPRTGPGDKPCNGCEGTGHRRPSSTWYPFSVENVEQFAAFLADCGGFEIN